MKNHLSILSDASENDEDKIQDGVTKEEDNTFDDNLSGTS